MKRRQKEVNAQNGVGLGVEKAAMLPRTTATEKPRGSFSRRHPVSKGRKYVCSVLLALILIFGINAIVKHVTTTRTKNAPQPKQVAPPSLLFPREPKLEKGCSVKFQHTNMSLCYFLPYGANFGDELGPAAVKRLLEYHFECSSSDVHVIDMASANPGLKRENRTCLFALGSIFHYTRTGDHVWGTGINPTHQGAHPEWLHVHSVRGPETARKMKEWYKKTVPQGDPGKTEALVGEKC